MSLVETVNQPDVQSDTDYEKPTSELDMDALLIRIKEWWNEDCDHCSKWHKEAKLDFDLRAGDQWPEEDKSLMTEVQKRACLVFNQVDPVIDTVAGAEITNRQEVRYVGRQVGDAPVNEVLTEAARWFRDECDAEHEESAAFADTACAGMGWTETRLDYEENPNGEPKIERVDPMEMFWDASAKQANLIDARRIYRRQIEIPLDEAKKKWPEGAEGQTLDDGDYDAGWATDFGDEDESPYKVHRGGEPRTHDAEGGKEPREVTIVQVQWYEKETYYRAAMVDPATGQQSQDELSEEEHLTALKRAQQVGHLYRGVKQTRRIYYKAFVGGVVLEVTKVVGASGTPAKSFSLVPITGKWDRSKRLFYGLGRAMRGPQTFANKWLSTAVDIMARQAKGGVMYEEGAVGDIQDFERDWAIPGRNAPVRPGALSGGKIQPKPESKFPADFMQMTQFAIASIRDVTGVNAESQGAQDQTQAASLEYQRRQSATIILAPLFDSLRRYRRIQGRVLLFLITEYLSDGRLIRIVGEEGDTYIPLLRDPGTVEYDVIVDDAPSSPSQKELVWNSVVQIMPMLQNMQPPPEVMLILLEYSPFPASVVAKIKQALAKAQGGQQQPSPMDLIMMEKKADVEAEQAKQQMRLQAKERENALEFEQKRKLAQIDIQAEIAKERIRVRAKAHDATIDAATNKQNTDHEHRFRARELDIDNYRAETERMHGAEATAAKKQEKAEKKKPEPKQPDYTPHILQLIEHIATQKKPTGVKRTKDGMQLIYDKTTH
jgi:hypothetical protein